MTFMRAATSRSTPGYATVQTLQDRAGVVTVPYTEFSAQVDARNVEAVFSRGDSIEGKLRSAAPIPDAPEGAAELPTYTDFQTERPTFD